MLKKYPKIKICFNKLMLISACFFSTVCFSQEETGSYDFSYIDNISKTIKYENDLPKLVHDLSINCNTKFDKSRAFYIWISENISYDYKYFNTRKKTKTFKCKDKIDCNKKLIAWERNYINKILKSKKAVCEGYSRLFKAMCDIAGIQADVIHGYIKTEPHQVGKMGVLDHAWNRFIIDGNHYYLDATWASGYCMTDEKGKLKSFVKSQNDYYWLTPIDKLSRNHYPKDTLKVVNSSYTKKLFKQNPYIKEALLPSIEILSPATGVLNVKIGDTIKFSFKYTKDIKYIQINTDKFKKSFHF